MDHGRKQAVADPRLKELKEKRPWQTLALSECFYSSFCFREAQSIKSPEWHTLERIAPDNDKAACDDIGRKSQIFEPPPEGLVFITPVEGVTVEIL